MSIECVGAEVREVNFAEAHFAEAAIFGGRPHRYPSWLCGLLHKRHFISCWCAAPEWRSHVQCGYCQRCRHFANSQLRYNWMPADEKPHIFHVRAWADGSSEIETNELYLHEILNLIEILALQERDAEDSEHGEYCIEMTTSNGGHSLRWPVNTLSRRMRLRVLSHLFIVYQHALRGDGEIPAERRWWHRLER